MRYNGKSPIWQTISSKKTITYLLRLSTSNDKGFMSSGISRSVKNGTGDIIFNSKPFRSWKRINCKKTNS